MLVDMLPGMVVMLKLLVVKGPVVVDMVPVLVDDGTSAGCLWYQYW